MRGIFYVDFFATVWNSRIVQTILNRAPIEKGRNVSQHSQLQSVRLPAPFPDGQMDSQTDRQSDKQMVFDSGNRSELRFFWKNENSIKLWNFF